MRSTTVTTYLITAATLSLAACGSATTTSSAEPPAPVESTEPSSLDRDSAADDLAAPSELGQASEHSESSTTSTVPASTEASTSIGEAESTVPVDPDADPTPVPGEIPDDLLPLEQLGEPGEPAPPTPVDPFVRVPFAAVSLPLPIEPVDPEPEQLDLVAELEANTPTAGEPVFTAATGCGSHCISGAWIERAGRPSMDYRLDVLLDVNSGVELDVFLTQAPIERNADGRYIAPFTQPSATGVATGGAAPGLSYWGTDFTLDPETTYHLLVRARDAQGSSAVAGTFTTAEAIGPDTLATPSPCADGCLDDIRVEASDDGRSLSLVVDSTVDADAEFQWAQGPLTQGPDGPTLDDPSVRSARIEAGVPSTLKVAGLTPHRSYSFVVIATDDFGSSDRWVATVSTQSPVIWAGIDRVHISGDGDPGSNNDGEISFTSGTWFEFWDYRDQEKLSSNSTVRLGRESGAALEADPLGRYPWIAVFAGEKDGVNIGACFVNDDPNGAWIPDSIVECNGARFMHSMARVPSMTLAEIEQLSTCAGFDVGNPDADRCIRVQTLPNSDQQVSFEMVVYFDLD